MAANSPGEHRGVCLERDLGGLEALTGTSVQRAPGLGLFTESPGQKLSFKYSLAPDFCWKWCSAFSCADAFLANWKESGLINAKEGIELKLRKREF